MSISQTSVSDLSLEDRSAWRTIQEGNSELHSPFFCIEYIEEVARLCPNVRVAILRKGGKPVAFWPIDKIRPGVARPVGGKIGCMQGVICGANTRWNGDALARVAGLKTWHFDHLLASQKIFNSSYFRTLDSPYLDLSEGFDAYREKRLQQGHSNQAIAEAQRKRRKMGREVGPIRFEADCQDVDILHQLIEWKRVQMLKTGKRNLFVHSPWIIPFLENSLNRRGDSFRGMMSVLYVADKPVSIHFGLRSKGNLHGLFFGYDQGVAEYSPGMVLIVSLAQNASNLGLTRIDLGKGDEPYKQRLKSDSTSVAIGAFDTQAVHALLRPLAYRLRTKVGRSAIGRPARLANGRLQRIRDQFRKQKG
tara:strand:+ start:1788 stop:2876 length:1089 start_codon:yes stop_codon:yes gene_type:complete